MFHFYLTLIIYFRHFLPYLPIFLLIQRHAPSFDALLSRSPLNWVTPLKLITYHLLYAICWCFGEKSKERVYALKKTMLGKSLISWIKGRHHPKTGKSYWSGRPCSRDIINTWILYLLLRKYFSATPVSLSLICFSAIPFHSEKWIRYFLCHLWVLAYIHLREALKIWTRTYTKVSIGIVPRKTHDWQFWVL